MSVLHAETLGCIRQYTNVAELLSYNVGCSVHCTLLAGSISIGGWWSTANASSLLGSQYNSYIALHVNDLAIVLCTCGSSDSLAVMCNVFTWHNNALL